MELTLNCVLIVGSTQENIVSKMGFFKLSEEEKARREAKRKFERDISKQKFKADLAKMKSKAATKSFSGRNYLKAVGFPTTIDKTKKKKRKRARRKIIVTKKILIRR